MPQEVQAVLFAIACVLGLMAWNLWLWLWRSLRRHLAVRRVAAHLGDPVISRSRRSGGDGSQVTGRFEGRHARVTLAHLRGDYMTCALKLDNALDGLVIYPTHGSSQAFLERQRRTGRLAALGEARLDAKFAIQGVPPELAARVFRTGSAEATLDLLFGPLRVMRVTIEDGWLIATRRLRPNRVAIAAESLRALQALSRVAPLFSRRELNLQLQGRSFAYTDGSRGESLVCPYCRDTLDVSGDAVARCEGCRTVHHEACYEEAGGCTVLGCTQQARGRRRVGRL